MEQEEALGTRFYILLVKAEQKYEKWQVRFQKKIKVQVNKFLVLETVNFYGDISEKTALIGVLHYL